MTVDAAVGVVKENVPDDADIPRSRDFELSELISVQENDYQNDLFP